MSNEKKERSFVVDAVILCVITIVLGVILASVYTMTKQPIAETQKGIDNEACEKVLTTVKKAADEVGYQVTLADAESGAVEQVNEFLQKHEINKSIRDGEVAEETSESYSKYVEVSTVKKIQLSGADAGYVFIADAKKGYAGSISFVMGVCGGVVTGVEITNQSETAGLGANCESEEFKAKFDFDKGIQYPSDDSYAMYYKAGTTPKDSSGQIEAMSGATVTTRAITNAVKGIMLYEKSLRGAE